MHACTRGRVLIRLRAVQRIDSSTHELEDAKRAHSVKVRACTLRISMYVNMLGLESQPKRMQIHRLWRWVFGCKTLFDFVQARDASNCWRLPKSWRGKEAANTWTKDPRDERRLG